MTWVYCDVTSVLFIFTLTLWWSRCRVFFISLIFNLPPGDVTVMPFSTLEGNSADPGCTCWEFPTKVCIPRLSNLSHVGTLGGCARLLVFLKLLFSVNLLEVLIMRKCLLGALVESIPLLSGELVVPFGLELCGVFPWDEITGGNCIILMVQNKTTVVLSDLWFYLYSYILLLVVSLNVTTIV